MPAQLPQHFQFYIVIYMVGMFGAIALNVVALVTPSWRDYKPKDSSNNNSNSSNVAMQQISFGLIMAVINQGNGGQQNANGSRDYLINAPDWKKASMACLVLSLGFCGLAFVWSCVACCMCCCKSCLTPPLPLFAGLACALDIAGVTLYGVKSGQTLGGIPSSWQEWQNLESKGDFGYSMWIGIGAIVVLFVVTLIGLILVKTAKISPL